MNALLVYPKFPDTYWSFRYALSFQGKRAAQPPLGLMTVAALLPASWNKRLIDTNVERLRDSDLAWADVVLLSGMHVQQEHLISIVRRCRALSIRTVVGGPIASSIAATELGADHVVIGEAETSSPISPATSKPAPLAPFTNPPSVPPWITPPCPISA
jgi:radical SAM superfamily enzyme YgiQ (UPF0313 family)